MYDKDFRGTIRSFFRRDPCIVAYFPGLAGSAGGLVDVSGNKYHATARNTPASYHGRFGGHAYRLVNARNIAPKHIDFPGSATITWIAGDKFSVLFWVYFSLTIAESAEVNYRFIEKGAASGGGACGNFNIAWNGTSVSFAYTNSAATTSYTILAGGRSAFVRAWNCIGITYTFPTSSDATPPGFYLNGLRLVAGAWNSTPNGTVKTATGETLTLGADQYSIAHSDDDRGLNGILDEIAFWKGRIVSPREMIRYYQNATRRVNPMHRLTDAIAAGSGSAVPVFQSNYSRKRRAA